MKDKLLFSKTYINKRSNGSNKGYWTKYVSSIIDLKNDLVLSSSINSFDEEMPIYTYFSNKIKRGLIIYQFNPLIINEDSPKYSKYITAWIQKRKIENNVFSVLTIYMLTSTQNIKTSKELIKLWLLKKRGTSELINEIYRNQDL